MRIHRAPHFVLLVFIAVLALGLQDLGAVERSTESTPLTKDDVLSIRGGQFYLDGQPFAEISFNKFDLFWQLYDQLEAGKALTDDNPIVQAQNRALRELHEMGFRTIRFFALPWGDRGPESYSEPQKRKFRLPDPAGNCFGTFGVIHASSKTIFISVSGCR